jgi:hypothetical protein
MPHDEHGPVITHQQCSWFVLACKLPKCKLNFRNRRPNQRPLTRPREWTAPPHCRNARYSLGRVRYKQLVEEKYISGAFADIGRPAVISVNMLIASLGVNELLARIHNYRDEPNSEYAVQTISLTHGALYAEPEGDPCKIFGRYVGRGDVAPLLDEIELSESGVA